MSAPAQRNHIPEQQQIPLPTSTTTTMVSGEHLPLCGALVNITNVVNDPNIVRRFCTETPLDFSVFAPFLNQAELPEPHNLHEEILPQLTSSTVSQHFDSIAEWVSLVSPQMPPVLEHASILHYAVLAGKMELLEKCLDLGADFSDSGFLRCSVTRAHMMRHGYAPAFLAACTGNVQVMEFLCTLGAATPMLHDRWGRTPLHGAAALLREDMIQWIFDNTEIGRNTVDRDAKRALDYLPVTASKDLVRLLTPVEVTKTVSNATLKAPILRCCHCRVAGPCSCPDVYFERWYMDRATSSWLPLDVALKLRTLAQQKK